MHGGGALRGDRRRGTGGRRRDSSGPGLPVQAGSLTRPAQLAGTGWQNVRLLQRQAAEGRAGEHRRLFVRHGNGAERRRPGKASLEGHEEVAFTKRVVSRKAARIVVQAADGAVVVTVKAVRSFATISVA